MLEGGSGDGDGPGGHAAFRRVLLKLSGQALAGDGHSIDPARTLEIAHYVRRVRERGVELAIVCLCRGVKGCFFTDRCFWITPKII